MQLKDLLQAKDYTSPELVAALNQLAVEPEDLVDLRTVQRSLKDLLELREIERDDQQRPPRYRMSQQLTPVEALVTHSALRMLYHHTPGYNALYVQTLNKLASRLPDPARAIALESTRANKNRRPDTGEALALVAEAWFKQRRIEFQYRKPGGSGNYRRNELEVYFIEISRANLGVYVIGYERGFHHARRTYKLERMRGVRLLGEAGAYSISTDFDPKKYLSNAWGVVGSSGGEPVLVRLRFKPEAAYRLSEGGYPDMSLEYQPDGSVEVELLVGTTNDNFPLELLSWVQGWGPRVEVLEPENLRRRWLEEAKMVVQIGGENG